jgi:hypothetical protein
MNFKRYAARFILIASTILLPSCNYKYDTVSFEAVGKASASATPVPKIAIDTNISVGSMMGGSVKSAKPYDIQAHYLDDTFTFATAEFTKVTVTYADGSVDPGVAALKLPLRFHARPYESHNSMAGGAIVVTKYRIIQAELPSTISRDEPFTLIIEGQFTKDNGTVIPFSISEKYNISQDKRTESWADFVSGC